MSKAPKTPDVSGAEDDPPFATDDVVEEPGPTVQPLTEAGNESLGKSLAAYQEELQKELATLNERVGPPSGSKIKAENHRFTTPDGQVGTELICVILDWRFVNALYKGAYNPNKPAGPVCWAVSKTHAGLAPDDSVVDRQNEQCQGCTFDKWGSDPNGGRGKACKNQRRLAVVPPNADIKTVPWTLYVPPASLQLFDAYVNMVSSTQSALPVQVVTKITFDTNAVYTKLNFELVRAVTDVEWPNIIQLRQLAKPVLDKGFEQDAQAA